MANLQTPQKPTMNESNPLAGIITLIIIVGVVIFIFFSCSSQSSSNNGSTGVDPKISAWVDATNAVQNELKAPSTASFPDYDASYVVDNGDGTYSVTSYVDAENSFGAKIRSNWSCTVHSNDSVTDIVID